MEPTRVVSMSGLSPSVEHEMGVLRIDGDSSWASPFQAEGEPPARALARFVVHLSDHPELMERIGILRGRVLGCGECQGKHCHGRILADLADGRETLASLLPRAERYLWGQGIDPEFYGLMGDLEIRRNPESRVRALFGQGLRVPKLSLFQPAA